MVCIFEGGLVLWAKVDGGFFYFMKEGYFVGLFICCGWG
jgi:hypothetical protein